jgi:predicted nucleotidyltransferase
MKSTLIEEIKYILNTLKNKYETVLFGSAVEGTMRPNSDFDIAILTRLKDKDQNKNIQKTLFGIAPLKYDIRVFELFPIYIQISIIENYLVIFGNPLEISEYFYIYRKKWDDCKYRILSNQFHHFRELLSLIK